MSCYFVYAWFCKYLFLLLFFSRFSNSLCILIKSIGSQQVNSPVIIIFFTRKHKTLYQYLPFFFTLKKINLTVA